MQRIMIIGCGGAGKTTLARQLQAITNIPVIHLDQHYWQSGWIEPSKEDWEKQVRQMIRQEAWIMDGNYGGTMDLRIARADTILFLDRSRWRCLLRVIQRVLIHYGKTRQDMAGGCPEYFSWEFLRYIYFYNQTRRPKILARLETLATQKNIVHLRSDRDIKTYLNTLITQKNKKNDF